MVVLVNRVSASASEIVSACLQDLKRAVVVGERTWGKGSVQNLIDLDGGRSALKLTTASYMRPSGMNIHRFPDSKQEDEWGVQPDDGFKVRFSIDEFEKWGAAQRARDIIQQGKKPETSETPAFADKQLEKALEYIGGKLGESSGDPLDLQVTVMGLARDARQPFGGGSAKLGDVAWLRVGDVWEGSASARANIDSSDADNSIDIIINTDRVQAFDPACFSVAGLDPMIPRALVVKSTQHFYAGFAPIAREVLYVATPGCGPMAFADIEHSLVTADLWPRLADPHNV